MIRRLAFVLALSLLMVSTAQAVEMVSVDRPQVNLRSGPGKKYPVIWNLNMGYPLKVLGRKGPWLKVADFENDTGWIFAGLTAKTPYLVVKRDGAVIRKGPGKKRTVIGRAERGVVLKTIKRQGGWVKVLHHQGLSGWMKRRFLWGW